MPTYTDLQFDDFLLRPLEASYTEQVGIESSAAYEQISGSQVKGDSITSVNRQLSLDLEKNSFIIHDGNVKRVELGTLPDNNIGLIIRDEQGNTLIQISGTTNVIKSSSGNIELNFNEQQLIIKDAGGTPRVLLGKGDF